MNIADLELHDCDVLCIEMKSQEGFIDNIYIHVGYQKEIIIIHCKDCYSVKINGNMWILGHDSIREIQIRDIEVERYRYSDLQEKKFDDYKKICISFNTTDTVIEVISKKIDAYMLLE